MSEKKDNPSFPLIRAVVDIGATAVRMAVAEMPGDGSWVIKEQLQQSLSIGRDTFTCGKIRFETIEACVRVLRHFKRTLAENWHIESPETIRAVATSAVREAGNRDQFVNRLWIATGIRVRPIDGAEVNRLTFLAVQPLLRAIPELQKDNLLLLEVGGGETEVMGLCNGRVNFAQVHRLGAFRVREMLEAYREPALRLEDLLETEIGGAVRIIKEGLVPERPVRILALGGECRFAARRLLSGWDGTSSVTLAVAALAGLAADVLHRPVEDLVNQFHMSLPEAETMAPALLAYVRLAQELKVDTIHVGTQTLRTGLLAEIAAEELENRGGWSDAFVTQMVHSAQEIGRKYHSDEAHAAQIMAYSLQLFATMRQEHRFAPRFATILTIAAILHEIGMFISNASHHKHTLYLIENSEIFGLGKTDLRMTALIARYHRRATPKLGHADYMELRAEMRLVVIQLAAILRLVDALDASHDQRLGDVTFDLKEDVLLIHTRYQGSLAAEKMALEVKGRMFAEVFGRQPILQTVKRGTATR